MADAGATGINSLGDLAVFTGWLYDSVNHALGGDSHQAALLQVENDPALSAMKGTPTDPTSDVIAAENVSQAEQGRQLRNLPGAIASAIPWWVYVLVGLALTLYIAGELGPMFAVARGFLGSKS